jgi:hypothetical protein
MMNKQRLFHAGVVTDILNGLGPYYYNEKFSNATISRYLKYIALQEGLGGFFTDRTAKEVLEGYYDYKIHERANLPLYKGGDFLRPEKLSFLNLTLPK